MNLAVDSIRYYWRRMKSDAQRGGLLSAVFCRILRDTVARFKPSATDLEDLALYLMYHPECGVLPCDGWKMRQRPRYTAEEIDALKRRHAADLGKVKDKLKVVDLSAADLPRNEQPVQRKIAVHVHCFYPEVMPRIEIALKNVPMPFDLFVSRSSGEDACPNRGRDIAPLICRHGQKLSDYDYIAHFHTKKSSHINDGGDWLEHILSALLGSPEKVAGIFSLLENGYGMVCASDFLPMKEDPTGWQHNLPVAEKVIVDAGLPYNLRNDYMPIIFPQSSMFWARGDFVRQMLTLPLKFEDFPEEPIGLDGSLAHAIERLLFVLGSVTGLKVAKIQE